MMKWLKFFRRDRTDIVTVEDKPEAGAEAEREENNKPPDPRVTPAVQRAIEHILSGKTKQALIVYFDGNDMYSATVNEHQDRALNIGMAQMYLMCQQATITAELIQPSIDDEDDDDDEDFTIKSDE